VPNGAPEHFAQSVKFLLLNQCWVGSWLVRVWRAQQKKIWRSTRTVRKVIERQRKGERQRRVMINGPGGTAKVINSHPGITSVQVAKYDRVINYSNRAHWMCKRELQTVMRDPGWVESWITSWPSWNICFLACGLSFIYVYWVARF